MFSLNLLNARELDLLLKYHYYLSIGDDWVKSFLLHSPHWEEVGVFILFVYPKCKRSGSSSIGV